VRVLRLRKVFHHIPELMVIIRGLGRALRGILVMIALIGLNIYVGAIVLTALLHGSALGGESFPNVNTSMGTLMLDCTLSGSRGTAVIRAAWNAHPMLGMLILLFVLWSNVTMLGILTGLLVQTVKTVADLEREEKSVKTCFKTMEELWHIFLLDADANNDCKISMDEFLDWMSLKETARVMRSLDIDVEGLVSTSAFVFEQHQGRLARMDFMDMLHNLRNGKKATVKDHIETRKFTQAALLGILNGAVGGGGK